MKKHVIKEFGEDSWVFDGLSFTDFLNAVEYAVFKCKLEKHILYVHEDNGKVLFKLDYSEG